MRRASIITIAAVIAGGFVWWWRAAPDSASSSGTNPKERDGSANRHAPHDEPLPSSPGESGFGVLAGQVRSSGQPVPGASLSLLRVGMSGTGEPVAFELETKTDAEGRFRIRTEPGRVRVLAEAPGHAVGESREVWLKPDAEITSLLIELGRDGRVTISVRSEEDQPVKGAEVEAFGLSSWQLPPAKTDQRGQATLERVPPGELRFRVRAPGYSTGESQAITLEPGAHAELTVVLGPLLGITGRVVNDRGEPVAGAQVSLRSAETPLSVISEKDGSFRFEALDEGLYALSAVHARHGPSPEKTAASGETEVELVLTRGGEIAGRVERFDGTPAEHFFVAVDRFVPIGGAAVKGRPFKPLEVRTKDGSFVLSDLAPGTYDLVADSPDEGAPATATNLEVAAGVRSGGLVLRLGPGGEIEGRVVDSAGAPVAEVAVRIGDAQRTNRQIPPQVTKSDGEGNFRFVGLAPGRKSIHTRKKGYISKVVAGVTVSTERPANVEIVIVPLAEGEKPKTEFFGIGAVLEQQKDGALVIQKIMDGTPSQQFGLQKGDRILTVEGEDAGRLGMERAVELIRGEEGTSVELEVIRAGDAYPFRVRIDRGRVSYEDR